MRKSLVLLALGLAAACGKDTKKTDAEGGNNTDPTVTADPNTYTGENPALMGRFVAPLTGDGNEFAWPGTRVMTRVSGATKLAINLSVANTYLTKPCYVNVSVDGGAATEIMIDYTNTKTSYDVPGFPTDGKAHQVTWSKITEAGYCQLVFKGFTTDGVAEKTSERPSRKIEFIGDSITLGYGVKGSMTIGAGDYCSGNPNNSSSDLSFAKLTADKLYAEYSMIAYSGKGLATNLDGTSSTSHGAGDVNNANNVMPAMFLDGVPPVSASSPTPIAWDASKFTPDLVVVNLGTNDFSVMNANGTPCFTAANAAARSAALCCPDSSFVTKYVTFLQTIRTTYPNASIALMNSVMLTDNYPAGGQQATTMKSYIDQIMAQFGDSKTFKVIYDPQDTSAPVGCDSHPSAATQAAMAEKLSAAITVQLGWQPLQ